MARIDAYRACLYCSVREATLATAIQFDRRLLSFSNRQLINRIEESGIAVMIFSAIPFNVQYFFRNAGNGSFSVCFNEVKDIWLSMSQIWTLANQLETSSSEAFEATLLHETGHILAQKLTGNDSETSAWISALAIREFNNSIVGISRDRLKYFFDSFLSE